MPRKPANYRAKNLEKARASLTSEKLSKNLEKARAARNALPSEVKSASAKVAAAARWEGHKSTQVVIRVSLEPWIAKLLDRDGKAKTIRQLLEAHYANQKPKQ